MVQLIFKSFMNELYAAFSIVISVLLLFVLIFNCVACSSDSLSATTHNIEMYKEKTYIPEENFRNGAEEGRYDSAIKVSLFLPEYEDIDGEAYVCDFYIYDTLSRMFGGCCYGLELKYENYEEDDFFMGVFVCFECDCLGK